MFYKKQKIRLVLTVLVSIFIMAVFMVGSVFALSDGVTEALSITSEPNNTRAYTEATPQILIEPVKILIDTPILFTDLDYFVSYDIESSTEYLNKVNESITQLETELATDKYTDPAHMTMLQELTRLQTIAIKIESDIELYTTWESEHYYAAKVWQYFKQRGYSDAVTSAILGNMMIETSGGTLNINPNIYSPGGSYYGLCQWSVYYYPGVAGLPFEYQLDYLLGDMPYQFNTFGNCYKYGFTYDDFLAMTDPAEAAYAFAKVYERCATWSCNLRRPTAVQAYNYFKL